MGPGSISFCKPSGHQRASVEHAPLSRSIVRSLSSGSVPHPWFSQREQEQEMHMATCFLFWEKGCPETTPGWGG